MIAQLIWTDKKGACHIEQGDAARLADKLKKLRCDADLWEIAADGQRTGEKLGGVELANAPDDKRIKWNWWYDKTAVGSNPRPPADRPA